eukprot:165258-Rhodomonas_salina.2
MPGTDAAFEQVDVTPEEYDRSAAVAICLCVPLGMRDAEWGVALSGRPRPPRTSRAPSSNAAAAPQVLLPSCSAAPISGVFHPIPACPPARLGSRADMSGAGAAGTCGTELLQFTDLREKESIGAMVRSAEGRRRLDRLAHRVLQCFEIEDPP